jgi:hypothetical protein
LDRLADALRLCEDAQENRERVTLLMSSLVGALLFARAIDDPVQSDIMLHSMRRHLRGQFCRDNESTKPSARSARSTDRTPACHHDFMRAF